MIGKTLNVLIAGSDFLIRKGICALINSIPGFHPVEAEGDEILQILSSGNGPDLLIYECEKVTLLTIDQVKRISKNPDLKVLLILGTFNKSEIQKLISYGIKGIITKKCSKEEINSAILSTSKGELFFCNKVLNIILNDADSKEDNDGNEVLSAREMEVLTLITKGNTTAAIAELLSLSVHTINSHRKNILRKLNLKSPIELIVYALDNNLIKKE